ncbi:MAG: TetR/AcrR family transcriptional regulator [Lachnospiraceae bacterium]|nr:TetR/AcrR family transcriptional regulator [Lachnospiraceae bacterium]
MHKRLSDDKLNALIEAGIQEFATNGYGGARLSAIAARAGISVGVIYKYYADKETLFLACVRYSLQALTDALMDVAGKSDDVFESLRSVVRTLISHAKEHQEINRMYHEITGVGASHFSAMLSKEVEEISAMVYTDLIRKAQEMGMCRTDADPALFAFFFDSLFMMVQFSYSCEYYQRRLELYCGKDIFRDDEKMEEELMKFLSGALGLKQQA